VDEIGLPAEKRRRLQDIDHRSDGFDVGLGMYVGQHRHADLPTHFCEELQALIQPGPRADFAPELRLALSYDALKM
jgi:hypothetical protein